MNPRQRGTLLIDALIGLLAVAAVVTTLNYAYRIAEHYTSVWGTVAGFAQMHEAERSYRRAGFTGAIDYTVMQVLMPGVRVHSATSAHRNGVGRPYELQLIGGNQVLTTLVDNEAQASQIVQKLAGKGSYAAEPNGYRISYRPVYVDPLPELVQRHSMYVSGPYGTHLYDRLNFGPGAIVIVGDPCLPLDGIHRNGVAIDAQGRPVSCVRIFPGTAIPDREWRLFPSSSPSPPPPNPLLPTEYCGDGTPVTSQIADCKDCLDGSNIPVGDTCPSVQIPRCGDGTAVADTSTECHDCWDGSNIYVGFTCPPQPTEQCGDGTYVFDRLTECQDCTDGTNIPITSTCPTQLYCGDFTPVIDPLTECKDCWDSSNIHISASCPPQPILEFCGDGTLVTDASTECQDCWDGTNIPIAGSCPPQPQCGDGTPVTDPTTECKDCPCGQNIDVDATCPTPPDQCGNGARVCDATTACQDCPGGSNIPVADQCPLGTSCCDGTVAYPPNSCPIEVTCWNGSKACPPATCPPRPTCGDGTIVTDPTTECKECCDGTNVHISETCPTETPCCDGTTACGTEVCPVEVTCWDGSKACPSTMCPIQPSCGDGTLVTDPAAECEDCCDGTNVAVGTCPPLNFSCADSSKTYPDCCCSTMTPIETQNMCSVVWSCPAKPILGWPVGQPAPPNFTIVTTEYECYIQRDLVCTGNIGACYGPGNYCASPTQIFYNQLTGICSGPTNELGESCSTGYVCGEAGLGP